MSLIINNHHNFHQHDAVTPIRCGLSGALQHSEGKTNSTEGNTVNTIK